MQTGRIRFGTSIFRFRFRLVGTGSDSGSHSNSKPAAWFRFRSEPTTWCEDLGWRSGACTGGRWQSGRWRGRRCWICQIHFLSPLFLSLIPIELFQICHFLSSFPRLWNEKQENETFFRARGFPPQTFFLKSTKCSSDQERKIKRSWTFGGPLHVNDRRRRRW